MFDLDHFKYNLKSKGFFYAGCDEVGRGPLAGPVIASCASLHFLKPNEKEFKEILTNFKRMGISDSKKINEFKKIKILSNFPELINHIENGVETNCVKNFEYPISRNVLLVISIQQISAHVIDEMNILNASLLAMKSSVESVYKKNLPGVVLIDGNKKISINSKKLKLEAIVKGDQKSIVIGFASIIAKVFRDQLMRKLDKEFPGYGWSKNAGYPTKFHRQAIIELGISKYHRKSFNGVKVVY